MNDESPGAPAWRRYLRFFGTRTVADFDDELRFHLELRIRDYMARGLSEDEARAAAARRLGDMALHRNDCVAIAARRQRRITRARLLDALVQDARFALRTLRRQPGWTAIAVVTLALGIGANAAMYSVVDHLLLHPLPFPGADRIVFAYQQPSRGNNTGISITITPIGRTVAAWRAGAHSFEDLQPYRTTDLTLERAGAPRAVAHATAVLPGFIRFIGNSPVLGRMFTADEAHTGAPVALLSEQLWRSGFGADRGIIGSVLRLNDADVTVIGVMPSLAEVQRGNDATTDVWVPLDLARSDDDGLSVIARLRSGVSRAAAAQELDRISARVGGGNLARYAAVLVGPTDRISYRDSLVLLAVAVALVLIIACANVAHLLLARAATRQREMAIRAALGAGRSRLFRQLLTESLLLSLAGCACGLLVGWVCLQVLVRTPPENLADLTRATMDVRTLLATAALSVATGIVFGLTGAVSGARHSTHEALRSTASAVSAGRAHSRLRSLLVVSEMALCTALLVGAALLVRSVVRLQTIDPGFDPRGLYALENQLPDDRYPTAESKHAFFTELMDRALHVPGVKAATLAASAPGSMSFLIGALQLDGQPDPEAGETGFLQYNGVQPDYFRMVGMRVVQGSTFTDTTDAAAQVIVNEGFARRHWPGASPIGKRLRVLYEGKGDWRTVVGVVNDALTGGLTMDGSAPMIYTPGTSIFHPAILVRATGDAGFVRTLAGIAATIDPHLPPPIVTSVEEAMAKSVARPRYTMLLLTVFALVAVGLAAIGLYGVLAYSVAQRTREIGIRMALGASRRRVARAVLSQGLTLALIGALLGLGAARAGTRLIGSMLYGIGQTDVIAYAAGGGLLVVIAMLACVIPVRRAVTVDPVTAIRAD